MKSFMLKRNLQIASAILIFTAICPYLYLFFNVEPVFTYGLETGRNALLQIYVPLCLIGVLGSISFLILLVSLIMKNKDEK